ncbi:MAG TPA: DOMON-like domain-containing protein [Hyphomonadaceae bacterium]|nr:DOMON-like domain-containing protein [Hyphomonadaceae bacterium]
MRHALTRHPSSVSPANAIDAEITRTAESLALRFTVTGDIGQLALPELANPTRADELWKHSCFEAFMMPEQGSGYSEVNLSSTGQWAAYHFKSHRSGMTNIAEATDPGVGTRAFGDRFDLSATFDLRRLPNLEGPWKVGLSVILEGLSGIRSYWALKHPVGKPDFHHADCFALRLPSAD